jgi:small conductance mechanosensitive channel
MLKYLKIAAFFLVLASAIPAQAQGLLPSAEPKKESVTINEDDLKGLITTLESETARTDLIKNLKTLEETQKNDQPTEPVEEAIAPLTKTLGVETFTNKAINKYEGFLERNDLKGSTVGKLALTIFVTLLGLSLLFGMRRGATKLLYWFDRGITWLDMPATRMRLYARVLRAAVTLGIAVLMLYTYTLIWDFENEKNPFETGWFKTTLGLLTNVMFVLALATAVWEALNATLQLTFRRMDGNNSTRAKTILPIARNVMFVVFAVIFSLVLLSEIGINIVPLLAGAGIVGVAIGFGAQTMVKDFLSGFTLILEDVMRVGDVIRIENLTGTVEKITLRKIQMRGTGGTVYTIPFSAVTIIENMTKDFSTYDFAINLPFETDADKVFGIIRDIVETMQNDPTYGAMILEPVDIWGVDTITENAIVVKGKIKTVAGKQWAVQREFNRRRTIAFAAHNIQQAVIPRSYQENRTLPPPEKA